MPDKAGFRVSVWFPNRDQWILHLLNAKMLVREHAGIPCSRAELLREIIIERLREDLPDE